MSPQEKFLEMHRVLKKIGSISAQVGHKEFCVRLEVVISLYQAWQSGKQVTLNVVDDDGEVHVQQEDVEIIEDDEVADNDELYDVGNDGVDVVYHDDDEDDDEDDDDEEDEVGTDCNAVDDDEFEEHEHDDDAVDDDVHEVDDVEHDDEPDDNEIDADHDVVDDVQHDDDDEVDNDDNDDNEIDADHDVVDDVQHDDDDDVDNDDNDDNEIDADHDVVDDVQHDDDDEVDNDDNDDDEIGADDECDEHEHDDDAVDDDEVHDAVHDDDEIDESKFMEQHAKKVVALKGKNGQMSNFRLPVSVTPRGRPKRGKRRVFGTPKKKVKLMLHTKQERLRVANISLTKDDLNTLLQKEWINDQVCLRKCHVCYTAYIPDHEAYIHKAVRQLNCKQYCTSVWLTIYFFVYTIVYKYMYKQLNSLRQTTTKMGKGHHICLRNGNID